MPVSPELLQQLCARAGVLRSYQDVWGKSHEVPDEALIALLAEFDIDASTDEAAYAALDGLRLQPWREALPPVLAITADRDAWTLTVCLPATVKHLHWRVVEEGGASHQGEASLPEAGGDVSEIEGVPYRQANLSLSLALPAGYHRLELDEVDGHTLLIAAPEHCYQPEALAHGERVWGPSLQLYSLRSQRNWGIGDFTDLAEVVEQWGARGASLVGVNPLHAMFSHDPWHASPYSPSSRQQLNTLYLDVEAIEDFEECEFARELVRSEAFQRRLAVLRESPTVDYAGVAQIKHEVLQLLHANFRELHPSGARAEQFQRFRAERGRPLRQHASFEALHAHFHAADPLVWGWSAWPPEYHDPASPLVEDFVAQHEAEVEYHEYLQWQADRQLAAVAERCGARGLALGLYLDLAVSVDRAGSDAWVHADTYAPQASVGAPPDELNPNGQGWGLPPLCPDRSRQSRHELFVSTLRTTMRHAGALRIDHVMGLMRLYWVPPGRSPRDGAYVLYPLRELIAIVALESVRERCLVIGEDLGTVPGEVREAMASHRLFSYRLLYFEREDGGVFKPPEAYPADALVAVSTHDLPPLAGWWRARDLAVRQALELYPAAEMHGQQLVERARDRLRLLEALRDAALLPPDTDPESAARLPLTPALREAVHALLARAPAKVMVVQVEDMLGLEDQANLPGTVNEHPNWRRKLPVTLESMRADEQIATLARRLAQLRPRIAPQAQEGGGAAARPVIPRATYRLQLHGSFGFDDAARILPYLARLGVSHVYCSPILRARPGSLHGYDVVAHDEINPELGGPEGFERFCAALEVHGLGLLLDMVPNHMGVLGADNPWWMDVLENGPASRYARHFDIDWQPAHPELQGKVLLPVLGDHYGDVLERGELRLAFEGETGTLVMRYFDHRFPLDPRTYPAVLEAARLARSDAPEGGEFAKLLEGFASLPAREAGDEESRLRRAEEQALLKRRFAELTQRPEVGPVLEAAIAAINTDTTRDALHGLHERQAWRLAYWRVAGDEVNYRRFFDINELAALRMEDPAVFEATQGFALDLAAAGRVDGLRIDHPDGLRDPAQYFERLQQGYAERAGIVRANSERPLYVVAEKIAAPHEDLPRDWAIHGTTGYRFAMVVGGVLVDGRAREAFDRLFRGFTGEREQFEEIAYQSKRAVMEHALASELTLLATALARIARADRRTRDYTFNAMRNALAEVAACMPVYRTYVVDRPSPQDRRVVDWAIARARRRWQASDPSVFDFVRRVLLLECVGARPRLAEDVRSFAARFQQFCAPVAAKGVEDTAFYRYVRLASLNEVGGDPAVFGITPRAFHGASAARAAHWPHTMLATSTHDNKRSEDVRNRMHVLSEMPSVWRLSVLRWHRMTRSYRVELEGRVAPSSADEYLLYQTLLGTLPAGVLDEATLASYRERIERYMIKAAREAKTRTSWTVPDEDYERALTAFVHGVLARVEPNPVLVNLRRRAALLAWFGTLNSLSTVLLKFTSPGVPDLYQGNELEDLSLVDPDNRRPVDYALREAALEELARLLDDPQRARRLAALAARPHTGHIKLWFTWRLLQMRQRHSKLLRDGGYTPLAVTGRHAEHVLAFSRTVPGTTLVVIAGRLFAGLLGRPGRLPLGRQIWEDTMVVFGEMNGPLRAENLLTGETMELEAGRIALAEAFAHVPGAALLIETPSYER